MKRVMILCTVMVLFLFAFQGSFVFASDIGFTTEPMVGDAAEEFLSAIELVGRNNEIKDRPIQCFDVSDDGLIAVGFKYSGWKIINVYTSTGVLKYGYQFKTPGDFGVEWGGNVLYIHFVRSDIALAVDESANVLHVSKIEQTSENNAYWYHILGSKECVVGNTRYTLENSMGPLNLIISTYSKLVIESADGGRTVIYDAGQAHMVRTILIITAVCLFVMVCIILLIREIKRSMTAWRER